LIPITLSSLLMYGFFGKSSSQTKPIETQDIKSKTTQIISYEEKIEKPKFIETKKVETNYTSFNSSKEKVIRADLLEKTGTIFRGTTKLKYTENGIKVPGSNYCVLIDGINYLPDSNLFINIPRDKLGKKVRLGILDSSQKKYQASFSTRIKIENVDNISTEKVNQKTLEKICSSNSRKNLEKKQGLETNVAEVYVDSSFSLENPFEQVMCLYGQTQKRSVVTEVLKGIDKGYKIGPVKDSLKNKDGYMRSNKKLVVQMKFGVNKDKTFTQMTIELKELGYSNKEIADSLKKETKSYFIDGKGININEEQVSDSLASANWISRQRYRTNSTYYNNQPKITIYDGPLIDRRTSIPLKTE